MEEDRLLTPVEAAEMLGLRPATLRSWRTRRVNLRFVLAGHRALYRAEDVVAFRETYHRTVEVSPR